MTGRGFARCDGKASKTEMLMTGDALPEPARFTVLQTGKDVYVEFLREAGGVETSGTTEVDGKPVTSTRARSPRSRSSDFGAPVDVAAPPASEIAEQRAYGG